MDFVSGTVKIADLGLAYRLGTRTFGAMGSTDWRPKELAKDCVISPFQDVFGIGALIIYLYLGLFPHQMREQEWELLRAFLGAPFQQLVRSCMHTIPSSRPSLQDLLRRILRLRRSDQPFLHIVESVVCRPSAVGFKNDAMST